MKKLFLLLLIFMLSTGVSIYGQVTLDGSVSSNTADDVDNISFSHTTGTGTNRLMLVGVSFNDFSGTNSVSSITFSYGATELSFTEVETAENSTARKSAIWSLLDPPSGQVGTVTVTFNSAVNYGIVAGVANFAGVDLTTPVETSNSATGNSSAQSVTLSGLTGDELVFDNVFLGGSSPVQNLIIGSSQTEQWSSTVANTRGATSIEQATGNSVTMSWSTSSSGQWAIAAVAINPAPTGPMIIITGTPLNHFSSQPGIPSTEQGYTVSGNNLTNDITITPPTDFEISTGTGGSFLATNPITLTQSGGSVVATTIYVRFKSSTLGTSSGNITHTSTGATQQDVAVSGFATPLGVDGDSHSNTGDDISSIDIPHTTGTGTNRLMLVGVSWNCGTTDRTISSITFTPDGESAIGMTEVITQLGYNASNPRYSAIYYLKNPPSGKVGTVTVTFSGSVSNGIMAGVANFSGVDQTTPLGTPGGGADNSTTPSVTLTGLNGNELVFDNVFLGAGSDTYTLSVGADQTELWNPAYVENLREAASIEQATGSSVTMSWTASTGNYWAIVAVPINPYSGPDVTNPTVTIDQAAGQNDPTNVSPINFKVVFNEPVTGFTTGDVTLGGSANPTTGTVTEISPFNGTTYNVAVSGITGSGTVTASISAGVAQDGSANPNDASTSTDNEVTYDITAPTVTINQAGTQDDPTCVSPINFTVVFSEPVNDFGSGDVTLGGTAGAT
ncbi:hypothetical protein LJE86_17925, partial [bacterium BMS3Abin03]|nr:hypothetical protein [bacterium BMS3Abin03]